MSISFDAIPDDIIEGGIYTEVRSTGPKGGAQHRALVVVPKLASGTLSTSAPQRVFSPGDAYRLCGKNSIGAAMIRAFMAAAPNVELYAIGFVPAAGVAANCSLTATADAATSGGGTIALYIGGVRVPVVVEAGLEGDGVEAAIVAAINLAAIDNPRLLVTAEVVQTGEPAVKSVKVTSKDTCALANSIDLRLNYYASDSRAAPKNVVVTIAPAGMATGAGVADADTIIAAIAGIPFDTIVWPDDAEAALKAWSDELDSRFGPQVQHDGHLFAAVEGDVAAATTAAAGLNGKHLTLIGSGDSPTMPCVWAATLAAVDAAEPDPARPRRTLPLPGVLAPPTIWDNADRRSALWGGISTWTVDAGGRVLVDRLITTYRKNADGIPDSSYREVTTLRTITSLRRRWNTRIQGRFPRHKLADDGVDYPPGQDVVQPKTIRAESIALHREWEQDGLVQNPKAFAENLIVERNLQDRNRLDVRMRVTIVGKFLTLATLLEFEH